MIEYGVLECVTISAAISLSTLAVRDINNGVTHNCANSDTTLCQYETYAEADQPLIGINELTSATQITVTGVNFALGSHSTCEMTFEGVTADTCTINSAEMIVGTYDLGVPSVESETLATVTLMHDGGIMNNIIKNPLIGGVDVDGNVVTVGITNPLSISGQTEGLICSFNGGCAFEVMAAGLA